IEPFAQSKKSWAPPSVICMPAPSPPQLPLRGGRLVGSGGTIAERVSKTIPAASETDEGPIGSSLLLPRTHQDYDLLVTDVWPPTERKILESLDAMVSRPEVAAQLDTIGERVLATLARGPREIEAWETVPLSLYGGRLEPEIKSSWVFVLRQGVTTGAERHPN